MAVAPRDREAPASDELGAQGRQRQERAGIRSDDASLLAQPAALGAGTIAPELLQAEVRHGAVDPVQREAVGAIELDLGRGLGIGKIERHRLSVAQAGVWS